MLVFKANKMIRQGTTRARSPIHGVSLFLYLMAAAGFAYVQFVGLAQSNNLPIQMTAMFAGLFALWYLDRLEARLEHTATPIISIHARLGLRLIFIVGLVGLDGFHLAVGLLALIPLQAFYSLEQRSAISWTALAFATLIILLSAFKPSWYTSGTYVYTTALAVLALGLAVHVALTVRHEQNARAHSERLLSELEASHRQLGAYAERVAELATLEERNRLAREIHDSLGHYLTALNIQLEKALVFNDKKPSESLQATRDAKRLADEALTDVRRSVSTLRDAQAVFHLEPALERLVQTVREGSDLEVTLDLQGSPRGYPQQSLHALFRAAQEGLTNVIRHAGAKAVRLQVVLGTTNAQLSLQDDGRGFDATSSGGEHKSYGLLGLRERLELVGGQLQIHSQHGHGTQLKIRIPRDYGLVEQP